MSTRQPTPRDNPGRHAAERIARGLREAGHVAYFAGGCVRDELLGLVPSDYDVATDAPPDRVRELFHNSRYVGEAFGVVLVRLMGEEVEVATFRTEWGYADGRRPDEVHFSDAEHDAQRRDFTINGLFEDPQTNQIIDFVGGQADLKAGIIRAIGVADERFAEDYLRMLRAVRFAARLGFTLEAATEAAIRKHASKLAQISRERIGQEIEWMLTGPRPAQAAAMLQQLGLDEPVLMEPRHAAPTSTGPVAGAAAIANPIDASHPQDVKVRQLVELSKANQPVVDELLRKIDAELGTRSKSSLKSPRNIVAKANRPSIKAHRPWFDVEHVRDALRFKTVLRRLEDVRRICEIVRAHGLAIVQFDTAKMLAPKEWGWRFIAINLRMDNGQLVEYYMPLEELEQAKKQGNHELFEKWRNSTQAQLHSNWAAYRRDLSVSYQRYEQAWRQALARLGLDASAAAAAWKSIVASLGSTTGDQSSLSSSAEGTSASEAKRQVPPTRRAGQSKSQTNTSPEPSWTDTIGKEGVPRTGEGSDIASDSTPSIGPKGAEGKREPAVALPTVAALGPSPRYACVLAAWVLDRRAALVFAAASGDLPSLIDTAALKRDLARWREALCLSNEVRDAVAGIFTLLPRALRWRELGVAQRKRLLAQVHWPLAWDVLRAMATYGVTELVAIIERDAQPLIAQGVAPEPLVNGDDLVAMGLKPGPDFRRILDAVYDEQLEGRLTTRDAALRRLHEIT